VDFAQSKKGGSFQEVNRISKVCGSILEALTQIARDEPHATDSHQASASLSKSNEIWEMASSVLSFTTVLSCRSAVARRWCVDRCLREGRSPRGGGGRYWSMGDHCRSRIAKRKSIIRLEILAQDTGLSAQRGDERTKAAAGKTLR